MPAACRSPPKECFASGLLVEVVGLRIELGSESYNLILVYTQAARAIDLAYSVVFKILPVYFGIDHFSPELSLKETNTTRLAQGGFNDPQGKGCLAWHGPRRQWPSFHRFGRTHRNSLFFPDPL